MKKLFLIFLSGLLILTLENAIADSHQSIRLAIFDNPQPDPSRNESVQQYKESYIAGINTAITVAASKGFYITEKEFFHENNLTSIIKQASEAKAWNPEVIMGFSTSNDFLMSKAFFGDQVILSISATDPALTSLPHGFYSLGIPDTEAVNVIIDFIHQHYPDSNLFITVAAESKESIDFADLLGKKFQEKFKDKTAIESKFLTDDINHLSFNNFMLGYKKNDVIVVMSIGYDSAIDLMNKISDYLKPIRPTFVTSVDNWGNNTVSQKMNNYYDAFRIDTLSGGEDSKSYKIFFNTYEKIYHRPPKDKITFITYETVMSFVDAIQKYPPKFINKNSILNSYLKALKNNPNWYRPPSYMVYKLENQSEKSYEKIINPLYKYD